MSASKTSGQKRSVLREGRKRARETETTGKTKRESQYKVLVDELEAAVDMHAPE